MLPPMDGGVQESRTERMTAATSASPAIPDKERIALYSLFATIGLLLFKLTVGLHTGSLGILAEAANSGLDLLASALTWTSIRIAARPADANHPFGHGRFENFSAFLETALLLITAVIVAFSSLRRWLGGVAPAVHLDAWAFLVMLTSMAVDFLRSRALRRAARQYDSDALEADALNFSTDMWSSLAVLIGLGLVGLGQRYGVADLLHADAAAALAVAAAMFWMAWSLGRRTVGVLLDEAPVAMLRELRAAVAGIADVIDIEQLRMRRSGSRYFVDLRLGIARTLTLERSRLVRERVTECIQGLLPNADVMIETEPREPRSASVAETVRAIAQRANLNIHDLSVYDIGMGLNVEFHLEVDERMPLAAAHDLVSRMEGQMRREIPAICEIVTHIEPETSAIAAASVLERERITRAVIALSARVEHMVDCHDVQVKNIGGHLGLTCHCSFADDLPVGIVHEQVTRFEAAVKREIPELFRVTIHTEPASDNRR